MLERTLHEADAELKSLRPRAQALEFELEGAKEEARSLSTLNSRLKDRLSTLRKTLDLGGAGPTVLAPEGPDM